MKTVAFHTLGCKVNQYETQAMSELFEKNDYTVIEDTKKSDVYVINTCTVTNMGDKKSRQFIRRVKRINPDAIIAVVGCYAQTSPEEVEKIEGVNIIIGTNQRNKIVELVEDASIKQKINVVDDIMKVDQFEEMSIQEIKEKTRVVLKIQEGCNQYCSYCIIPYARGRIRSRNKEEIVKEVENLVKNGFKEIVLTGIHVASYGKDWNEENSLLSLLLHLNNIEGLKRLRLSSLEPTLFNEHFTIKLSQLEKVCPHFHLSLQSGCNKTLKDMNRKYTTQQYREIVKRIRKIYPDVSLTTDIIVGFPGETEKDFEETYEFVKEMEFSDVHVFKFSPRNGTPAAEFKGQVDGSLKNDRSVRLIKLVENMKRAYLDKFIGKTVEVLIENDSKDKKGYVEGTTDNYIKVVCKAEGQDGQLIKVCLKSIKNGYIEGEIV
ncbi:tRNA (N(6)-L-threonylcarbamoyladenosine(37)-C(2))-methylthiotransferase MtaB [Serpentinicella sp. ANB-PHB4]|uniref:tRNA (N(6)-L-threonylcarbamoyladenosine(37)-C(2))- methylthiotransferase MtaB n=1 Tax=Serpentinicella sp. ANB-PHB4 TaxID=3074076 RepID=UPI00285B0BDB|nr:tRNA (N(6)-L-threonylcarbamoyladenosine(37)-C(2))-methylthiotransferase MtaB [Serpentinicella sp. ANB-PHB4]MDR5657974.1 tRNA (N(6)-L-threonylcarbamoyladenosine(37)-C(2))-methylthiotransferase MtaB [Serpentinicella sp. ANB-PHB4]